MLWLTNLIKDGVVNATAFNERIERDSQDLQSVETCHNTVIRSLIMGKLLLLSEISIELETVDVFRVLQIVVVLASDQLLNDDRLLLGYSLFLFDFNG